LADDILMPTRPPPQRAAAAVRSRTASAPKHAGPLARRRQWPAEAWEELLSWKGRCAAAAGYRRPRPAGSLVIAFPAVAAAAAAPPQHGAADEL